MKILFLLYHQIEAKSYIHGELICSLGVDGEVAESDKLPSPPLFDTDDFDECGTISIS
jgi:hypothetical protein